MSGIKVKSIFLLFVLVTASAYSGMAQKISGIIRDKQDGTPLMGAGIICTGESAGTVKAVSNSDGFYSISLSEGVYTFTFVCTGYNDLIMNKVEIHADTTLNIVMEMDMHLLDEVAVTARKNLEGEKALQLERMDANYAVENLGAREMGIKGIGNVEEGVKKITGISIAQNGQLIVRGLGDRYSITTLNGLPIASPNPDNKLIPLELFPSSVVEYINVSKVYNPENYADYSGAHIDIKTKEQVGNDFLKLELSTGGIFKTLFNDFYSMDRAGSLFTASKVSSTAIEMDLIDFEEYVKEHDIFDTGFSVKKKNARPDLGILISGGRKIKTGNQTLSIIGSANIDNNFSSMRDGIYKTLEATGTTQNDFKYDSYEESLDVAALASISLTLRREDYINYTFFYARNASDEYKRREGIDAEGHELIGSNNVTHIYRLINHQVKGSHIFDKKWELDWDGSYSRTASNEPDRRQVMYIKNDEGGLSLFKLNRQETMRYFGSLNENEWVGSLSVKYGWKEKNNITVGINYKDKERDYMGTRFYYNLNRLNPVIENIYETDGFLNQENISSGLITIDRKKQPKDSYLAGNEIYAGYILADICFKERFYINGGFRYEMSRQWVKYASDGGDLYSKLRKLNTGDIFPAINLRYLVGGHQNLRLSISRTVTRPSFIEMAPFLYQESYGSAQIRGNENLGNGYNYNIDFRYELLSEKGDMFSLTLYYKYLDNPIERVQELNGGATLHSFRNAEDGLATGAEIEFKKRILKELNLCANASYMYTNVKLPEGGAYTNKSRPLQGASPLLVNADLTYSPKFKDGKELNLALLYNMQGRRIHAVGISGLGDIKEEAFHSLNFNARYNLNRMLSFGIKIRNILDMPVEFYQDVPSTGERELVERYDTGRGFEIGFGINF